MLKLTLNKAIFRDKKTNIIKSDNFEINTFTYNSGIKAIELKNSKGHLIVLPFMGQMIWDANFLDVDMCMKNMFSEPKNAKTIIETYGCFSFHSGLISNGCPSSIDTHLLHGEMPCAEMDSAWLEITEERITLKGSYEYIMGFGNHYLAIPSLTLEKNSSMFDIEMSVTNLGSQSMPLQYMCHMNTAFFENATLSQNIPTEAIKIRESIPAHVQPTEQWLSYNETLNTSEAISMLSDKKMYDPEIVYFADNLSQYTDEAIFEMDISEKHKLITKFSTEQFNYATRWILYNADQTVGAYVLPATCRPEGFMAAKNNGTLIELGPNKTRNFKVTTGIIDKNLSDISQHF